MKRHLSIGRDKCLAFGAILAGLSLVFALYPARISAAGGSAASVTDEMLLAAQDNSEAWLHYARNYESWRFAPMDQINRDTVKRLTPKWVYQTGIQGGGFEVTAAEHNGKMYVTTPNSHLICLDAHTGRPIWRFDHIMPVGVNLCCGPVNRGVAIKGGKVYWVTLDARLMCFDADTGLQLWDRAVADFRDSYSLTLAPLVVKDKVIVGIAGAEYGIRGFIDAYFADTGEHCWRFWTVPGAGEPGSETWEGDSWMNGGGSAWVTGSYDPELNLIFWGVGNPSPDFNGDVRKGDNLYTDSIVALNADTGELRWHFQAVPHDVFDWDGVSEPILVEEEIKGQKVKAVIQANRNGYLYALDRATGKFLYASAYSNSNWAIMDAEGKPVVDPELLKKKTIRVCPGLFGGKNWPPAAYSPRTHMIYIPDQERCSSFTSSEVTFRRGLPYYGGLLIFDDNSKVNGFLKAVDVRTGEMKWNFEMGTPNWAGVLATGGGLVFAGAPDGMLRAFNDETGEILWQFQTGSGVFAPPTTFVLDGNQHVGLASGWGQPAEAIGLVTESRGSAYYLFGLME